MRLTEFAVRRRAVSYFLFAMLLGGGVASYFKLGQLEDPEFTIKDAAIVTFYPGATAQEVEEEVTDKIELAAQELIELKEVESCSMPGVSTVKVVIKSAYQSDQLPQIWDHLHKKVSKVHLPPGAGPPQINDDLGFVYGFVFAVYADGLGYKELEHYVKELRKELSLLPGVARTALWGVQKKCIYLDFSVSRMANLGLSMADIQNALVQQNMVVDAGSVDFQGERMRFEIANAFTSTQDIENLVITSAMSRLTGGAELIRLRDIATVRESFIEPPEALMRYNGYPAYAIALAPGSGENVVEVGQAIQARVEELKAELPVGIEVAQVAYQADLVSEAIQSFMVSLAQSVAIVLAVLALSMGIRMGLVIGLGGLVLVILSTFMGMALLGYDLERMSLGALIVAMGMMVDNAIVVADSYMVRVQQGMAKDQAAIEAGHLPALPLLGATVIATLSFYPIFASTENAGEYCASLFLIVGLSLMLSWFLAVTLVPVLCMDLLKVEPQAAQDGKQSGKGFRRILELALRLRYPFLGVCVALLALSAFGFQFVTQMFFPKSTRLQFMVDYWAPEGTTVQATDGGLRQVEAYLRKQEGVVSVTAFVGQGPPRFYLPVSPEAPNSSYGQLIVSAGSLGDIERLISEVEAWGQASIPNAMLRVRKYGLGPDEPWPLEVRFSGPAGASPETLRALAEQGLEILRNEPRAKEIRHNWRERTKLVVPEYNAEQGRWTGVFPGDLAEATKRTFDGQQVGLYREGEDLYPIVMRHAEEDRQNLQNLASVPVRSQLGRSSVPLGQVAPEIEVGWEDKLITRFNRRRCITVQCAPHNASFQELRAAVVDKFDAIELPPGYSMMWDGEYLSSKDSQASLIPGIVPAVVLMVFIVVLLFNGLRVASIVFLLIPFVLIGITPGLLVLNKPFGFVALLGAMSLAGMMIKNAIVLLDQINLELAEGKHAYNAVVDSALLRARPVVLAAATTVLGMVPIVNDVFWESLAAVIMFGLSVGTVLTLVLLPVMYCIFFGVRPPKGTPQTTLGKLR